MIFSSTKIGDFWYKRFQNCEISKSFAPKITYFGHITMSRSSAIYFYLIKGWMRAVGLSRHPVSSAVLAKIPPTINLLNRDLYRVDNYPASLLTSSAVTSANKLALSFFSVLHICADNPWSSQRRSFSRPPSHAGQALPRGHDEAIDCSWWPGPEDFRIHDNG